MPQPHDNKGYCTRLTKSRPNPNFGIKLPSNRRVEACRARVFVPPSTSALLLRKKGSPSLLPLNWGERGNRSPAEPQILKSASGLTPPRRAAAAATHSESSSTSHRPGNDFATSGGPGTDLSPPTGKRQNDSPGFRFLKPGGGSELVVTLAATPRRSLFTV